MTLPIVYLDFGKFYRVTGNYQANILFGLRAELPILTDVLVMWQFEKAGAELRTSRMSAENRK
jgi:hypothetical protein